ncbi:MAG: tRNA (adenosine(37)-N6)-threonylcarbamoyltransferase complex ATPase subunit type 1 TsaE [Aminipila sp.]
MNKIIIKNENETKKFGLALAEKLKPGSVVALIGDLGTGKTALTKYIAEGLGVKQMITSPTFTIVREYEDGRLPLYHFDVYRINDVEEMFEIGYEEYFFGKGVSIVEWADLISEIMPEESIIINISYGENEGERIYEIREPEAMG